MEIKKSYRSFGPEDLIVKEPMSNLDALIYKLLQQPEYKGKDKQYFLDALEKIAFVESKNQNIKQIGGGPGRGYFQIEKPTLETGYNRLKQLRKTLGVNLNIPKVDDARELSFEDQAAITLANLTRGGYSLPDFGDTKTVWLERHWAGPEHQREQRARHYEEAINYLEKYGSKLKKEEKKEPIYQDPVRHFLEEDSKKNKLPGTIPLKP